MTAAVLDVRGDACPITWVKTRLALDRLLVGEVLEVWLREGEPLESVPRTAEEEGHEVLEVAPLEAEPPGSFRVRLARGAPVDAGPVP